MTKKVAILGLDSVPPELLFDKLLGKLPNLNRMYRLGAHGRLRTCDPPITVPAWMVMMTGKDPGQLGIYGFRHRKGPAYSDGYIVNSTHVRERTVWEVLAAHGKRSIVIGVPPGYPPKPIPNVTSVSCFITPSAERPFTYPEELKEELLKVVGGKYIFDVTFRTEDREGIKKELFEMTEKRFDLAEHLLKTRPWDFFMLHEIGFDRLHHAFWKFFDPTHPKYEAGNRYERIDEEYYAMVDQRIGRLLPLFGEDCTTFVLSDHGSKAMAGGFCVNQWLEQEGYLQFKKEPTAVTDFDKAEVDWGRTKAWGWGGYYARIFFNVKGREQQGVIEAGDLESEKRKLTEKIMGITDAKGMKMENMVLQPERVYAQATGDKPDLMVYFGNLDWRSAGTVGHDSLYLAENDTGPDDSVHSMDGVMLTFKPGADFKGIEVHGAKAQNIGATLLTVMGLDPGKEGFPGTPIEGVTK